MNRVNDTNKKIEPMMTCSPWKPVAIKNVDPKEESAIQNGASTYSKPWKPVKIAPKETVSRRENFALLKLFLIISWWDQVILTPEDNSKIVFRSGILIGLNELTEQGGHIWPNSTVGETLLWKKAQKKDTKKNTSDAMNKIIPVFNPLITNSEWFPWSEASRWISRHHEKAIKSIRIRDTDTIFIVILFIIIKPDATKQKAPFEARRGQGLVSTRWKGLNFIINFILFLLCTG